LIAKVIDGWVKRREREHIKFYSTLEYQMMFHKAGINYIAGKVVVFVIPGFTMKIHIGEKSLRQL